MPIKLTNRIKKIIRRTRAKRQGKGWKKSITPFYKNIKKSEYCFTRSWIDEVVYTTSGSGEAFNAFEFPLSALPSISEFQNLFDQYKILNTKVTLTYKGGNVDDIANITVIELPTAYYAKDYDSTGAISLLNLMQYGNMKSHTYGDKANVKQSFFIPPYVRRNMGDIGGGVLVRQGPLKSPWIDMTSPDVNHGCVKWILKGTPTTSYAFQVHYKCTFLCKNVR